MVKKNNWRISDLQIYGKEKKQKHAFSTIHLSISSIISNSLNKYWQTFFWGEFEQIAALILPNLETIMISMTIPSCYNDNDNIDDDNNWVSVVSFVDSSISVKLKPRAIFKNYIL